MFNLAPFIGHRGLAAHAPENTLAGIRRAADAGLQWVEIDVRLAADGVAVLSHDSSLRRCGGGGVQVGDKTAAQLATIAVSCGFAEYAAECVPSLAAALALSKSLNMGVVVEIKPHKKNETAVVAAVADAIIHASPRLIISSFSMPMLAAVRRQIPAVARAVNCNKITESVFAELKKHEAQNLHCAQNNNKAAIAAAAGVCGVYCFTVDNEIFAQALFAAGAHGVFTNGEFIGCRR